MISTISADAPASVSASVPAVSLADLHRASAGIIELTHDFSADGDFAFHGTLRSDLDPPLRDRPLLESTGRLIWAHRPLTPATEFRCDDALGQAISDMRIAASRIAVRVWSIAGDPSWQQAFLPSLVVRAIHTRRDVSAQVLLQTRVSSRRVRVAEWERDVDGIVVGRQRANPPQISLPSFSATMKTIAHDETVLVETERMISSVSAAMTRIIAGPEGGAA